MCCVLRLEVLEEISVDDWRVGGGRTEPHLTRHTDRTTRSDETPSTISLLSFQYTTEHPEPEVFSLYIVRWSQGISLKDLFPKWITGVQFSFITAWPVGSSLSFLMKAQAPPVLQNQPLTQTCKLSWNVPIKHRTFNFITALDPHSTLIW